MPFEILENCRIDIEKFNYEEPKWSFIESLAGAKI
jgi:hypothetical protein